MSNKPAGAGAYSSVCCGSRAAAGRPGSASSSSRAAAAGSSSSCTACSLRLMARLRTPISLIQLLIGLAQPLPHLAGAPGQIFQTPS